jgi:hypothetical protein
MRIKKEGEKGMERFEKTLNDNHGKILLNFNYNGRKYEIRTTDHTYKHLERKFDFNTVCGDIVALGKERLDCYADKGEDVAIIDMENDMTVIITFEGNQIRVRTVIDKSNVWVKKGTKIFRLYK